MKIHQLSVFLENRPGQLITPCKVLAQAGINILTLSVADTQQFGILRLLIREWERAKAVLEQVGCVVNVTEVVAIEVADRPGELAGVLEAIGKANINVEYMYAFSYRRDKQAILVFRFDNQQKAIEALQKAGMNPVSSLDLYDKMEQQPT